MDELEKAFVIDSATTAAEAFDLVATQINLQDPTGFGLFEVYNNIGNYIHTRWGLTEMQRGSLPHRIFCRTLSPKPSH